MGDGHEEYISSSHVRMTDSIGRHTAAIKGAIAYLGGTAILRDICKDRLQQTSHNRPPGLEDVGYCRRSIRRKLGAFVPSCLVSLSVCRPCASSHRF